VRASVRACHRHDDGNSHVAIAEPSRVRLHRAREVCIFLSRLYIPEEIMVVKWQNVSVSLQSYIFVMIITFRITKIKPFLLYSQNLSHESVK